jgi:hypothetical protein
VRFLVLDACCKLKRFKALLSVQNDTKMPVQERAFYLMKSEQRPTL